MIRAPEDGQVCVEACAIKGRCRDDITASGQESQDNFLHSGAVPGVFRPAIHAVCHFCSTRQSAGRLLADTRLIGGDGVRPATGSLGAASCLRLDLDKRALPAHAALHSSWSRRARAVWSRRDGASTTRSRQGSLPP